MRTREWGAVGALAAIVVITFAWWSLALWPLPNEAPYWLVRARVVCFGSTSSGLPEPAGWLSLIGQPIMMFILLLILWGDALSDGLRALSARAAGRFAVRAGIVVLVAAVAAAGGRIAGAVQLARAASPAAEIELPDSYPRVDRSAPDFHLVDQRGDSATLRRFTGRPVLVTFAYAHCETVCPLAVSEVLRAANLLGDINPAVLVFTLDPWRDTPARLAHIARSWRLQAGALVLGGTVPAVEQALDGWDIARTRDQKSGEISHPALVYVVDGAGQIAYVVEANATAIAELTRRL